MAQKEDSFERSVRTVDLPNLKGAKRDALPLCSLKAQTTQTRLNETQLSSAEGIILLTTAHLYSII